MAAVLIRSAMERTPLGEKLVHIYKCSGCGEEVSHYRKITGMDTYCGKCSKKRTQGRIEQHEKSLIDAGVKKTVEFYIPRMKALLDVSEPKRATELIKGIIADMEAEIN